VNRRRFNTLFGASVVSVAIPTRDVSPIDAAALSANNYLKKGDKVGMITPAGIINKKRLENAIKNMKSIGLTPYHTDRVLLKKGYLAGSDKVRIEELHQMYADKSIKGIWCIRGGYGTTRIVDQLDFNLIKKNPKPLIGYSDITALLNTIQRKTGSPCYHGPVGVSTMTDYSKEHFAPIFGTSKTYTINHAKENIEKAKTNPLFQFYTIKSGTVKGKMVGGNLTLVTSLIGTKHQVNAKNRILFLEDVGEEPYRIDRMLTQLISSGALNKVRGIVFGICAGCNRKEDDENQTLKEVIMDRIGGLGIPAAYGFSFGHIDHHFTIPIGVDAEVNMDTGIINFKP